jgi:hypothetical protein
VVDLQNQFGDLLDLRWQELVEQMAHDVPAHVIHTLYGEFLELVAEDLQATVRAMKRDTASGVEVFVTIRPNVVTAFIRQAHAMRFMPDPTIAKPYHVKPGRVPRGVVAHRERVRRESLQ